MAPGGHEEGVGQIRQGLDVWRDTGAKAAWTYWLSLLAEAYGKAEQREEGLRVLAEALTLVDSYEERFWEAEIHRLYGELLLRPASDTSAEAESCFHKALDIARRQQATVPHGDAPTVNIVRFSDIYCIIATSVLEN